MFRRVVSLLLFLVLLSSYGFAKDKKAKLPDFVLQAHSVFVEIDPDAQAPLDNPNANRAAQDQVEKAFLRWGRFDMAMEPQNADLIVVVQKGSGKMVSPTIGGIPQGNRPVIFQPTDGSIRIGGRQGRVPGQAPSASGPQPGTQIGGAEDRFEVYRGGFDNGAPTGAPVWRYVAKDALNAPDVLAVAQFRKAIEEAEKQAQKSKKKQQP
jgi:hypothetical protein